jgi:hypothetical protein
VPGDAICRRSPVPELGFACAAAARARYGDGLDDDGRGLDAAATSAQRPQSHPVPVQRGDRRRHYGQADPGGDQPSHGLPRTYPLTVLRPVDGVVTEAATFAVRDVPARSAHPVRGLGPESVDDVVLGHSYPTTEAPTIGRLTALDAGLPAYRCA